MLKHCMLTVTQTTFDGISFTSFLYQGPSCTKMEHIFPLYKLRNPKGFGFQITSSEFRIPVSKFFWILESLGFLYTGRVWITMFNLPSFPKCCEEPSCSFQFSLALVQRLRRTRYDVSLMFLNRFRILVYLYFLLST